MTVSISMSILGWLLFGFVVGLVARVIVPGKDSFGLIGATLLGMLGGLVGGWVGHTAGWYSASDELSFLGATIGAIAILLIYNGFGYFRRKRFEKESVELMEKEIPQEARSKDQGQDHDQDKKAA